MVMVSENWLVIYGRGKALKLLYIGECAGLVL